MKLYIAVERGNNQIKIGFSTNPPSYMKHLRWKYGLDFRLVTSYPLSHSILSFHDYGVKYFIDYWLFDCLAKVNNKAGNAARGIYSLNCFPVQKFYEYLTRKELEILDNELLPKCHSCGNVFNFDASKLGSLVDLEIHLSTNSYCSRECLNKGNERIHKIEECSICHEEYTVKYFNQLFCSTKCEATFNRLKAIRPSVEEKEKRNKRTWQI